MYAIIHIYKKGMGQEASLSIDKEFYSMLLEIILHTIHLLITFLDCYHK